MQISLKIKSIKFIENFPFSGTRSKREIYEGKESEIELHIKTPTTTVNDASSKNHFWSHRILSTEQTSSKQIEAKDDTYICY